MKFFMLKNAPLKTPCVLALGTFDGFHLGHQRVIETARKISKKLGLQLVVATFTPHPQEVVNKHKTVKLLTTIDERKALASCLGADHLLVIDFDRSLAGMPAQVFAQDIIAKKINASCVVVGNDYTFGAHKSGDIAKLKKLGLKFGFSVVGVTDKVENGKIVKSTRIRKLVAEGQFLHAVKLLGHPYTICGKVVKGFGRGKELGYPTANISVAETSKLLPLDGVYACFAVHGKKVSNAIVNIGKNPTFGNKNITVEVHLIGLRIALTGSALCLHLVKRLRNEKKFKNIEQLKAQIGADVTIAKKYLLWYNKNKQIYKKFV